MPIAFKSLIMMKWRTTWKFLKKCHFSKINLILKPQYTIEIIGSHGIGISSLVERIVNHNYTGTFEAGNEYFFDYEKGDNILHIRLLVTYNDRFESVNQVDARINVDKYTHDFSREGYNSCHIQVMCVTKKDENTRIIAHLDSIDCFYISALNNLGISELMDSITDRIIQKEYIQQNFKESNNILDMLDDGFEKLYPCMLIGYQATSIILPRSLTVLYPNTFYGLINPFDLILKHTQIEKIYPSTLYSIPIRSVSFPRTLKTIERMNFQNCDNYLGIIDLSQTNVEVLSSVFIDMNVSQILFPTTLKEIYSDCFSNFVCPVLDFRQSDIQIISEDSFERYNGNVLINYSTLKRVPTSFLNRLCNNGIMDLSHTNIEVITMDKCFYGRVCVNSIIFPHSLKEISRSIFEFADHPIVFDFSNTQIEGLFPVDYDCYITQANIDKRMIQRWKEEKISQIIIPTTCKAITSSLLYWFTTDDVIDFSQTCIEYLYVDLWMENFYNNIRFPNSLKSIQTKSRLNLTHFEEIDMSNTQIETLDTVINNDLVRLILPPNLKKINDFCFNDFISPLDLDLSHFPLIEIGYSAFNNSMIKTIIFPQSLTTIGFRCFSRCCIKNYDLSMTQIESLPDEAFSFSQVESITLPSSLRSIGKLCFYRCNNLKHIEIPNNTSYIEENAFGETQIMFLTFPENVKDYSHSLMNYEKLNIITLSPDRFTINLNGNSSDGTIFCSENMEIFVNRNENGGYPKIIKGNFSIIEPIHQQQDPSIAEAILDFNELVKVRTIRTTNYGRIVLMRDSNGNMFVCKRYENRSEITERCFLRELETQIVLKHPTILPLAGHFYLPGRNCNCICTKFCEMGTLADKMKNDPGFMTSSRRLICIIDTILAMIHISENEIIHRDIKPSNIFIDGEFFLVGDFGISKFAFDVRDELTGVVGTFGSQAPEVLTSAEYSEKSDVFSCGMVFFELLTGQSVFVEGITPQVFNQRIIEGRHPVIPQDINNNARTLLEMCLSVNKEDRRTFREILDFLLSVDFMIIDEFDDTVLKHIASLHKFL